MAKAPSVTAAWQQIEAWLEANADDIAETLARGATAAAIDKVEKRLGLKLPADVRESWSRHNGADESDLFPAVDPDEQAYSLLSLGDAAKEWARLKRLTADGQEFDADRGIRAEPFNPGWFPVATNGAGDYHCIDLAPARGGTAGQVIECRHETGERRLVARSWAARLRDVAAGLERGTYVLDGSAGIVRPSEKPAKESSAPAAKATDASERSLTRDQQLILKAARAPGPPIKDPYRSHGGVWEDRKYIQLLRAVDPKLRHFGPCRQPQREAIERLGNVTDLTMFYENFAPRPGFTVNGVRLLSIEEMADATIAFGVEKLVVMAVHDATGTRFAFDVNRADTSYRTPIVRIPPGVTPPSPRNRDLFKKDKALDKVAPDAAAHLGDFLKKLALPRHRLVG